MDFHTTARLHSSRRDGKLRSARHKRTSTASASQKNAQAGASENGDGGGGGKNGARTANNEAGPTPAQRRVLEVVVFGLLAYASAHGVMGVIERILTRVRHPNWQLLVYTIYAVIIVSVFSAILFVTFDDDPDNDVFRQEQQSDHDESELQE